MEAVVDSRPVLILKDRKAGSRKRYVIDQSSIAIGRDQASYIVLPSRSISRHHAVITEDSGDFYLTDLKSSNGTFLNEQPIPTEEKTLLRKGDCIRIETFELTFQPTGDEREKDFYEKTDTDLLEIKMLKKVLKAIDKDNAPSLEVTSGKHKGQRVVLSQNTQDVTIGRDKDCELSIDNDTISRKHAKLIKRWDLVTLIDLKSKNGTYVGREKVTEQPLQDGDRILLGDVALHYRNPQEINFEALTPEKKAAPMPLTLKPASEEKIPSPSLLPQTEVMPSQALPQSISRSATPFKKSRFSTGEILLILLGLGVLTLALVGIAVLM